jgi:translation elongation factor EF-1beta
MIRKHLAVWASALAFLSLPLAGTAAEKSHGSMPGMKMEGAMEGHGMMKMGDKIFSGKVGPWQGEARLMDMKAHMEKAKASGMKMEGMAMKSHHVAFGLTDPKTKKPVTEGKGSVTVIGPDKKEERSDFMVMEGHFGADVNLPRPGKYTFKVNLESGGKKGSATFRHTVK